MCGGGGTQQQPRQTVPPPVVPAKATAPKKAKRGGRPGTILTGALGVQDQPTASKTLLGG